MFGRIGGGSSSGSKGGSSGSGGSHESKSGGSVCGIDRRDIRSITHEYTSDRSKSGTICITPQKTTDCFVSHYVEPGAGNRGGDGSRSGEGDSGSSQSSSVFNERSINTTGINSPSTPNFCSLSSAPNVIAFDSYVLKKHGTGLMGSNGRHDLYLSGNNLAVHEVLYRAQAASTSGWGAIE